MLLRLLGRLDGETGFLVVDNGSPGIEGIGASIRAHKNCEGLIELGENQGLGRALNIGMQWALDNGREFVLLFDQDSFPSENFVSSMVGAYREAARHSGRGVAAVGPRILNLQSKRRLPFRMLSRVVKRNDQAFAGSKIHYATDFLIISGSLIALKHIGDIGIMKESYFIDNLDLEWCFRAKSKGFDLVGTDAAMLYHIIGEQVASPMVRAGLVSYHDPARTYYSSRNRTHLRRMEYAPLVWKIRDRVRFTLKTCWLLLTSPRRKEYWYNIRAGVRDGKVME